MSGAGPHLDLPGWRREHVTTGRLDATVAVVAAVTWAGLLVAWAPGCRCPLTQERGASSAAAPVGRTPRPPGAEAYACDSDSDCMNSCALGATNRGWYASSGAAATECLDGCAGSWAAPPRCLGGRCLAFDFRGWLREDCTLKAIQERGARCRVLSAGFDGVLAKATERCSKDSDCAEFSAGIGDNCGGVTDGKTADALGRIEERFRTLDCPYVLACAARKRPTPRCVSNVCRGAR